MGILVPKLHICICYALIASLSLFLINLQAAHSALTTQSVLFNNFVVPTNVFPVIINGLPYRDYETSQDPTRNSGIGGADDNIASGCPFNNANPACPDSNCNPNTSTDPTINGGIPYNACGMETSAFWGIWDPDNNSGTCESAMGDGDEILFFRIRLNGNPNNHLAFTNTTWHVFIEISGDGWNDFQVAVDGNVGSGANATDQVKIFNNTSTTTQRCVLGTSCTQRDVFLACNRRAGSPNTNCQTQSHTRSITATGFNQFPDSDTNEYMLDVQVPITAFTNSSGARQIFCNTPLRLAFGTASSPNDAFQKDAIPGCAPNQQCSFSSPTPITLSYFKAEESGGGIRFTWTTATETANAGFNLYSQGEDGTEKLNTEIILSKTVNSLYPQDYEYQTTNSGGGIVFYISDVDITGKEKLHGPFEIDTEYGSIETTEEIDWKTIKQENTEKNLKRTITLKNQAITKTKNIKSRLNSLVKTNADIQSIQAQLPSVDIIVSEEGIYRVYYEDLLGAGADLLGVLSSDIALTNFSNPVPIYVNSTGNTFGPGSYIEFFGKGHKTLYTDKNVYILSVNPILAQRVSVDNKNSNLTNFSGSYLKTLIVDNNKNYFIGSPDDPWYDTRFQATSSSPKSKTINFNIDNLASTGGNLSVKLIGGIDFSGIIDHHFTIELNSVQIANKTFDGVMGFISNIDLSTTSAQLHNGTNELKIIVPGDNAPIDIIYFDSFSVSYPRNYSATDGSLIFNATGNAFRVTNLISKNVVVYRISDTGVTKINSLNTQQNGTIYTVSFSGNKTNQFKYAVYNDETVLMPDLQLSQPFADIKSGFAQYLIISHPDFIDELTGLVNERKKDYSVKTVNVNDIYAQFSHSIFDPSGIKKYIKYAYENMGTRFVLLVGADTYDYLNYLEAGSFSFIPTLYDKTSPFVTYAPTDSLLADVDGDKVQDLAIGRFPVRTSADLSLILQKTLTYLYSKNKKAVFAADIDDAGTSFSNNSDELADYLPDGWTVDRAYVQDLGVAGAKSLLVDSLNDPVEGSRAFTSFVGHSSFGIWTLSGLFNRDDAKNLTNFDNPTVVSQFGCWNTYFVEPKVNTMAHRFLLNGTNGASLVSGPASLSDDSSQKSFGMLFYDNIFSGITVGEASMEAKQTMAATGQLKMDVILGWNLLGDPALVVVD